MSKPDPADDPTEVAADHDQESLPADDTPVDGESEPPPPDPPDLPDDWVPV